MSKLINVYGGPGAGKTTVAATIFAHLKQTGRHAELCLEYAKELVYRGGIGPGMEDLIMEEQLWRHDTYVIGEVDYVVTDAPLLHKASFSHGKEYKVMVEEARVMEDKYTSVLHLMLPEPVGCDMRGRMHDADQSASIHRRTLMTLATEGIEVVNVVNIPQALEAVFDFINAGR